MDNGPARENRIAQKLQAIGEEIGDPFEVSTVRREVCYVIIYDLLIEILLFRILILLTIKVK